MATVFSFLISVQLFRWEPEQKVSRRAMAWAAAALIPFLLLGAWELSYGQRLTNAQKLFPPAWRPGIPAQTPR